MSNFLRVEDVKLPTAAYAKSLQLPVEDQKELIQLYETALSENNASGHKWKQFRLEKRRYHRIHRKTSRPEKKPEQSTMDTIFNAFYGIFGGMNFSK